MLWCHKKTKKRIYAIIATHVWGNAADLLELAKTKQVLVIAHGNSIRAMVKMLDNLSNTEIVDVNIPTGIPLAYKISENENVKIGYLGDLDKIEQLKKEVELQSKVKDEKG